SWRTTAGCRRARWPTTSTFRWGRSRPAPAPASDTLLICSRESWNDPAAGLRRPRRPGRAGGGAGALATHARAAARGRPAAGAFPGNGRRAVAGRLAPAAARPAPPEEGPTRGAARGRPRDRGGRRLRARSGDDVDRQLVDRGA